MSATPTADRLNRRLLIWTVVLGLVCTAFFAVAASTDADGGMRALLFVGGGLAFLVGMVMVAMRAWLNYQQGQAGR